MRYRLRKEAYWVIVFLIAGIALYQAAVARDEAELARSQQQQFHYEQLRQFHELKNKIKDLNQSTDDVKKGLEEFLEMFRVEEVEITGYAPLDPRAIEGMCFSGDPEVTASGEPTQIGVTVAAGPDVEFGTKVWIEGHGWRVVHDRGGKVASRNIDIAVRTREEAFEIGRRKAVVLWPKGGESGVVE